MSPETLIHHETDVPAEWPINSIESQIGDIVEPVVEPRRSENKIEKMEEWAEVIMPAMREMVDRMYEPLKNCEYDIIIGEDASGRIPTLIIRSLINRISRFLKQPPPTTIFVAGSSRLIHKGEDQEKYKLLTNFFKKHFDQTGHTHKKALVVTEYIHTGEGIRVNTSALQQLGKEHDVAAVNVNGTNYERIKHLESLFTGRLFYSDINAPYIYNNAKISGVSKHPKELHATPLMKKVGTTSSQVYSQAAINAARRQAELIAEQLFKDFLARYQTGREK